MYGSDVSRMRKARTNHDRLDDMTMISDTDEIKADSNAISTLNREQ